MTILQRAAGPAAKRKGSIREAGAQSRGDQLRQRGHPEVFCRTAKDRLPVACRRRVQDHPRVSGIERRSFFIDTKGIIREKFFEAKYRDRLTGNNLIAKLFPELGDEVSDTVDAPHLQVAVEQSDRSGVPGGRITLTAEVRLPAGIHVYAPGTKGYKTVELSIESQLGLETTPSVYPRAKVLYMSAIKERVPVFEGAFRIRQDLKVSSAAGFSNSLGTAGKTFTIAGKLEYQACDSKQCFFPMSVPLHWQVQIVPLDRQRAPENIQHK